MPAATTARRRVGARMFASAAGSARKSRHRRADFVRARTAYLTGERIHFRGGRPRYPTPLTSIPF